MSVPSHQQLMAADARLSLPVPRRGRHRQTGGRGRQGAEPVGRRSVLRLAERTTDGLRQPPELGARLSVKAGLIDTPRRGFYRATERGRELLAEGVEEIDVAVLSRYPEFVAWRAQQRPYDCVLAAEGKESPEEQIALHHQILNAELARELVEAGAFVQPCLLRAPDRRSARAHGLRRRPAGNGPCARAGRRRRRRRR